MNAAQLGWAQEVKRRRAEGELHVRFCCELYSLQAEAGRYFLHEHPANVASWRLAELQELLETNGVQRVVGDQCQYGQETGKGEPAKKPIIWFSNSPEIRKRLQRLCQGRAGKCTRPAAGDHVAASGEAAREATV